MSKLENNTINLQSILNAVNNLPNAGSATEDLEAELAAQETLITNITTALQNKVTGSGAGGSVETCNVVLSCPANFNLMYHYVDNGEIKCKTLFLPVEISPSMYSSFSLDFSCIAKGSYLVCGIGITTATTVPVYINGDAECLSDSTSMQSGFTCGHIFKINGDCTINITTQQGGTSGGAG